jgi:hypothetical protein
MANNTNPEERMEVGELPKFQFMYATLSLREKHNPFVWRKKGDNGRTKNIHMQDMETDHLLRALGYAEQQSDYHAKMEELFMTKYEELLYVLSERGISEDEAKRRILALRPLQVQH